MLVICAMLLPAHAFAATQSSSEVEMWRLYNSYTGEHLFTSDTYERDVCASNGWQLEGIGWIAPETSNVPVYRLYNPNSGDHHYTMDANEYEELGRIGWSQEGIGWYSDENETVPLYRLFNPNEAIGTHHYTTDKNENDTLDELGWNAEGYAWFALEDGTAYTAGSNIMGDSKATAQSMAAWFKSKHVEYPSADLAPGGAPTIEDFATIVCEEAAAEGVRAEVVFCQSMLETGWLRFGNQVSIEQYNFAGIGATDGGAAGASFASVREGIRAQVQHLKCYACTLPLENPCVDPRFHLVKRGCAPTVEQLSKHWASSSEYGANILGLMNQLLNYA